MKTGRTIQELARELVRQQETKVDYIADTRQIHLTTPIAMEGRTPRVMMALDKASMVGIEQHAHRQIAERVKVPAQYYDRMLKEAPELLQRNVNHWFAAQPERRMLRTLDGNLRAFLSDRYRPIDNMDLASAVLPVLHDADKDMRIESCEVTPSRMYIKARFPRITEEVKVGDVVQAGLAISNSENGSGALRIEPFVFRLICLNGMISATALKRSHVGGRAILDNEDGGAVEFYRDETLKADDKALWLKVQDTVRAAVSSAAFARTVAAMRDSTDVQMKISPMKVVERLATRFTLQEDERDSVLMHLIKDGDLSQYGLLNAVTRASQDVESYDRATELERMGGQILTLPRNDWKVLAEAA